MQGGVQGRAEPRRPLQFIQEEFPIVSQGSGPGDVALKIKIPATSVGRDNK